MTKPAANATETLSLAQAEALVFAALSAAGTSETNARSVAAALIAAEADGQRGHGLSRVAAYAAQVKVGKVDGQAVPKVEPLSASAVRIDAGAGFAFPALDVARDVLRHMARDSVVAVA